MSAKSFHAKLGAEGHALFFEVPLDVKKEFGKARPAVKVSINGYNYRSTVSVYGGKYYVPVRREHREEAGLKAGDIIKVTVALDTEVRTIKPPSELASAFKKNVAARERWERLSYTHKKEHADAILQAKRPETRARRIEKTLAMLAAKAR
jgi:regulator of protease activity HflC (stomatin/prohibitin superfamily)